MRRAFAIGLVLLMIGSVRGQEYPTRPVTIVVPTAVSSVADIVARSLAPLLGQRLGQSVVVENRTGAGGNIAVAYAAKAAPDGHTVLLSSNAMVIAPLLQKSVGYDPIADFAPIGRLGTTVLALVVNPQVAAKSVDELVRLAASQPGRLNYATPGNGTPQHLAMEHFKQLKGGLAITHIPFAQSGAAMSELVAGRVEMAFVALTQALPQVRSEKLRALALAGDARSSALPDIPSFRELGVEALDNPWVGLLAPARTSPAIVNRLAAEIGTLLSRPEQQEVMTKAGIVPAVNSPAEFGEQMRRDLARWRKVIEAAGIKPD